MSILEKLGLPGPKVLVLHGTFSVSFTSNRGQLTFALPDEQREVCWVFLGTSLTEEDGALVFRGGGKADHGAGVEWRHGRLISIGADAAKLRRHMETLKLEPGTIEAELRARTHYVEGAE